MIKKSISEIMTSGMKKMNKLKKCNIYLGFPPSNQISQDICNKIKKKKWKKKKRKRDIVFN